MGPSKPWILMPPPQHLTSIVRGRFQKNFYEEIEAQMYQERSLQSQQNFSNCGLHCLGLLHTYMQAHSCLTLCNPRDCSPPGSSVHGVLQPRILDWVAIPSSGGSSYPVIESQPPASPALAGGLYHSATGKALSWSQTHTHLCLS